jgi:hypothetical protein
MNMIHLDMVNQPPTVVHRFEGVGGRNLFSISLLSFSDREFPCSGQPIGQLFAPWDVQRPLFTGQGRLSGDVQGVIGPKFTQNRQNRQTWEKFVNATLTRYPVMVRSEA